jgi:cytochrome c-type biogenesis protein CcmH/NrfF
MKRVAAALAALALLAAGPAAASELHPTQSELEAELVCPTCHEPLDESDSPIAQQMKAFIRKHIAMGWTKSEIENYFVKHLGPQVLGVPSKHGFDLLAWVLPIGGIGIGAVGIGAGAWVWSHNRDGDPPVPEGASLDPALDRRVDEELAAFDG